MINIKFPHIANKNGFTLIELLVVIAIIGILAMGGIAAFLNYSRAQILQQATNGLVNTLNTAKAKAAAQVKPTGCLPPTNKVLNGYDVVLTKGTSPNPDFYTLNAICDGIDVTPSILTVSFPSGVNLDSYMPNQSKITFSVLTGAVVSGNIILDGSQLGLPSKTITIDSGGNIKISTWTFCANEGGQCSFTGTKEVIYGANSQYYYKIFTYGTPCTNAVFGDPLYGTVKQCYYQDTNP